MAKRFAAFERITLLLGAAIVLGAVAWGGFSLFQPVAVPPVPPPRAHVTFDARADVRQNPLFGTLEAVFRGEVEPGVMGRTNPFTRFSSGAIRGAELPDAGSVQEISLNGGQAIALARATNGAMLVLIRGVTPIGTDLFEIRRYPQEGEPTTVARWELSALTDAEVDPQALVPVALQQDGYNKVWLLSQGGYAGVVQSNGIPLWMTAPVFRDVVAERMIAFGTIVTDGAGRLWMTDGTNVVVGNGIGFESFNVEQRLTEGQRATVEAESQAAAATDWSASAFSALAGALRLNSAASLRAPTRLQGLPDGRVAIVTPLFAVIVPLDIQAQAQVILATDDVSGFPSAGALSLAVGPDGTLWASRGTELVNVWATGSRAYNAGPMPVQVRQNPHLFVVGASSFLALDYREDTTVLWSGSGGSWFAQVVPAMGVQPADIADRVAVDNGGVLWAILRQHGLLRVDPPDAR